MSMPYLTEEIKFPVDRFNRCQLCGVENDIVKFQMWIECDDSDRPIEGQILIICREGECYQKLDEHPRLYHEVTWDLGAPGFFKLLCGDCKHRDAFSCTHPDKKDKGGSGLKVKFERHPFGGIRVCKSNNTTEEPFNSLQAIECAGKE